MNKLASILYIMKQGFPTLDVTILPKINPEDYARRMYTKQPYGWVVRCGAPPDYNAKPEGALPWEAVSSEEGIVKAVKRIAKEVMNGYLIFIHPQRCMDRAGNLLITPTYIVVEGCFGPYTNLARLAAGKDSPQQHLIFRPGMLGVENHEGKRVFTLDDLLQIRNVERRLVTDPSSDATIEFSFNGRKIDLHDIRVN